jgi:hypothetical protein
MKIVNAALSVPDAAFRALRQVDVFSNSLKLSSGSLVSMGVWGVGACRCACRYLRRRIKGLRSTS